jgi:type IV secretion system protein TrbB
MSGPNGATGDLVLARRLSSLTRAIGPAIARALDEPDVVEALINADGRLRVDRVGRGIEDTDTVLTIAEREAAVRLLAAAAHEIVSPDRPCLSATLPGSGARVQAMLAPLVAAPVLAIRKKPSRIFSFDDYVEADIATDCQIETLRAAITAKRNIVVAGGTGSGKTTLLNACLAEPQYLTARVIILEDTAELQCHAGDVVHLLTKRTPPAISMRDLVQMTLRLRPDRIVVGEVRDGAALEVLKAWNTGHPGGLLTLHANSAADALLRLEDLCLEAGLLRPERLIASAVDIVVFIARTPEGRRIEDILDLRISTEGGSRGAEH